jgi:hypothetical protein
VARTNNVLYARRDGFRVCAEMYPVTFIVFIVHVAGKEPAPKTQHPFLAAWVHRQRQRRPAVFPSTRRSMLLPILLLLSSTALSKRISSSSNTSWPTHQTLPNYELSSLSVAEGKCPPCFNCLLPAFTCGQYGHCDEYNGQCQCPPGWGGIDCLVPQCDSLADGDQRRLREEGKGCDCKDGWEGINCNGK